MSSPTDPRQLQIATHNGTFHADDVFGVAVLQALYPNASLVRTRDEAVIAAADFAVDVGGEWDSGRGRFDHHQRGFKGARTSGVVYASAGLVWRDYGSAWVHKLLSLDDPELCAAIAQDLDAELVQHLDRADTGADHGAPGLFGLAALISQLNPTWDNPEAANKNSNVSLHNFLKAVELTSVFLQAAADQTRSKHKGAQLVRDARREMNGAVLVMHRGGLPWAEVVCKEMPEVLFVIYPDSSDRQYQLHVVTVEPHSFVARKDLPRAWAGLRDADLAAACGVEDAVFCHNGRFIAGARSLDGALRMAALALHEASAA